MTALTKKIDFDGRQIKILSVPFYRQGQSEFLCFVFSVQMVCEFLKKHPQFSRYAPSPTKKELIDLLGAEEETGVIVDNDAIKKLNNKYSPLIFNMTWYKDPLTVNERYNLILESMRKEKPVIVRYNSRYIHTREIGPGHAGVIIYADNDNLIFNNPWHGENYSYTKNTFIKSWEIEGYQMIIPELSIQERLDTNVT
jgi:hypothetical protein